MRLVGNILIFLGVAVMGAGAGYSLHPKAIEKPLVGPADCRQPLQNNEVEFGCDFGENATDYIRVTFALTKSTIIFAGGKQYTHRELPGKDLRSWQIERFEADHRGVGAIFLVRKEQ